MERKTLRYPGDPDQTVMLMTGQEFKDEIREGKPGYIKVGPIIGPGLEMDEEKTQTITFDEIICDQCNREIGEEDFLAMDRSHAVCQDCYEKLWKPYILP